MQNQSATDCAPKGFPKQWPKVCPNSTNASIEAPIVLGHALGRADFLEVADFGARFGAHLGARILAHFRARILGRASWGFLGGHALWGATQESVLEKVFRLPVGVLF